MPEEKFEVAFVGRIKHGKLYKFLREKGWSQAELPREWALIREVETRQLMGGKILALPSAEDEYAEREFVEHVKERIRESLEGLTLREKQVLTMRFGLGGENVHTLAAAGDKLGISRERVRELEILALKKLRGFRHGGKKYRGPLAELRDQ